MRAWHTWQASGRSARHSTATRSAMQTSLALKSLPACQPAGLAVCQSARAGHPAAAFCSSPAQACFQVPMLRSFPLDPCSMLSPALSLHCQRSHSPHSHPSSDL